MYMYINAVQNVEMFEFTPLGFYLNLGIATLQSKWLDGKYCCSFSDANSAPSTTEVLKLVLWCIVQV